MFEISLQYVQRREGPALRSRALPKGAFANEAEELQARFNP